MTPTVITAIVGAVATTVAAGFAAWAGLRGRAIDHRADEARLTYDAMRTLLEEYRTDNAVWRERYARDTDDLRSRMCVAEQRVTDLTAQVGRCEADKAAVEARVTAQAAELARLRRKVNGDV